MFKRFKTFLGIGGLPQATPDPSGAGQATGAVDGADHGQVVHMVFGDTPDFVLREAVSFVEEEGHLKLVESKNIYRSSPLLVFCKNNTKLQEDIRHAMENTRRGTDVMLIVVTDKPDLLLLDTIFTQNIGAKARLLYDQSRQKYGFTANSSTMKWMRNFLEKFGINVTLKLNRKDSLSKSLTTLLRGEATGSYHVLGDLAEEQLKNVIVFLDDKNVGLAQVEVTAAGSTYPLVLFCAGHQQPEQRIRGFMNNRIDPKDVSAVIIHRESHEVPIPEKVPCTILRLIISDTAPEVLDIAQNRRTVGALRKFLKRRGAPEGRRQAAKPEAVVGPSSFSAEGESPGQSDDDPQGGASSESVAMDWDDRVSQPESPRMPGSVSDYPARAEPPSRNISSDSFPLQQSEHTQSNSTERYSQHPRSGSYQRQPPEQPTSDIRQPIRHYSAPPPYVAPRPQPSWIQAPGQPLPPVPQQPLHYTDYPYEQSVCQGQLSEIQRYRLSAHPTDAESNTFSLISTDRTADTTESVGKGSVPGSSSQRRDLNAGSWSKRRRRRPELPLQVQHGTPTAENGTSTAAAANRLMVVMVNEINKDPGLGSTRMVQLRWNLDFAGQTEKSTVRKIITDFIKPRDQEETANGEQTQAVDATGRRPQTEKTKPTTSPKAFSNDAIRDPPDCLLREVGKKSDDLGATAGATSCAAVPFAYGRDKDWLLQDAVKFVEEHCGVTLSEAGNNSAESPLLVFCKEETGLVQDVRSAIGKTRKGTDVMLLVVTDKRDLPLDVLDRCDSTTGFGAKDCLLWDPSRKKFGTKENCDALLWIRQFLENFNFEANMKLSRTSSVRRSFKALGVKPISGAYYLAQPAKEQEEKAAVLFLNDHLIKLRKTDHSHASPLIVFCVAGDTLDAVIDKWTSKRQESQEALLVVLYRSYHIDRLQHLPSSVSKLRLSEDGREVASIADNNKVPASVRGFLSKARRRKNSFDQQQEPASREEQEVRQQDDGSSLSGVGCFRH